MLLQDTLRFLNQHFTPEGDPTPAHLKCLAQFRSSFKKAVKEVLFKEGGTAGEIHYSTEYGPHAARCQAEVRLKGAFPAWDFHAPRKLATPFLKKMNLIYPSQDLLRRALLHGDWGARMMRQSCGYVVGSEHTEEDGGGDLVVVMRAVMVFHYPHDALARGAYAARASGWEDQGLPEIAPSRWTFKDGTLHWSPPNLMCLTDQSALKWSRRAGRGRIGSELWSLELHNHCDERGIALAEAASNPRGCFQDLKVLADRLRVTTGESCVEDLPWEDPALWDTLTGPLRGWASQWARLCLPEGCPGIKSFRPKSPPPSEDPRPRGEAVAYNDEGDVARVGVRLTDGYDPGLSIGLDLQSRIRGLGAQEDLTWRPPEGATLDLRDPAQLQAVYAEITLQVLRLLKEMGETHPPLNFNPNR